MPRRPRGVFLTDRGLERLEAAISAAQEAEKYGKRFTQDELYETGLALTSQDRQENSTTL
jgi:hypothetical protein